jgi:hypothetical protein
MKTENRCSAPESFRSARASSEACTSVAIPRLTSDGPQVACSFVQRPTGNLFSPNVRASSGRVTCCSTKSRMSASVRSATCVVVAVTGWLVRRSTTVGASPQLRRYRTPNEANSGRSTLARRIADSMIACSDCSQARRTSTVACPRTLVASSLVESASFDWERSGSGDRGRREDRRIPLQPSP